jgi:hypothetical protein
MATAKSNQEEVDLTKLDMEGIDDSVMQSGMAASSMGLDWVQLNEGRRKDIDDAISVESESASDVVSSSSGDRDDIMDFVNQSRIRRSMHEKINDNNDRYFAQKIAKYAEDPKESFIINMIPIKTVPDILSSFDALRHLELKDAKITSVSTLPPKLVRVNLAKNDIEYISSTVFPPTIKEINLSKNKLKDAMFVSDLSGVDSIILSHNKITHMPDTVNNIQKLDFGDNKIETLDNVVSLGNLMTLNLNNNPIISVDKLADVCETLTFLDICVTKIPMIGNLPITLIKLIANNGEIQMINMESWPPNLEDLDLFNNHLQVCPDLHKRIKTVDLMDNKMKVLMNFEDSIESLDLRNNPEMEISEELKKKIDEINSKAADGDEIIMLGSDSDCVLTLGSRGNDTSGGHRLGGDEMSHGEWMMRLQSRLREGYVPGGSGTNTGRGRGRGRGSGIDHSRITIGRRLGLNRRVVPDYISKRVRVRHKNRYRL